MAGDGRAGIDAALVRRLIAAQFPQWRDLAIRPVEVDGWDNRTYRLGNDMTVRLPTHESYVPAVDKEQRWLPVLAPRLPVPIPTPLAKGAPGDGYPFSWSIRRWLSGEPASSERIADMPAFAVTLAEFLLALQRVDATGGPRAGSHSFYRGAPRRTMTAKPARRSPGWVAASTRRQRTSGTRRSRPTGRGHPRGSTVTSLSATCSCGTDA